MKLLSFLSFFFLVVFVMPNIEGSPYLSSVEGSPYLSNVENLSYLSNVMGSHYFLNEKVFPFIHAIYFFFAIYICLRNFSFDHVSTPIYRVQQDDYSSFRTVSRFW